MLAFTRLNNKVTQPSFLFSKSRTIITIKMVRLLVKSNASYDPQLNGT